MAFTASQMPDVVIRQEEMWADSRANRELQHPLNTARAVFDNQLVRWLPVMQGDMCIAVKAVWLRSCDDDVEECTDPKLSPITCNLEGKPISAFSKMYEPNLCIKKSFMVMDDECRDTFDTVEKIAFGMARTKLAIEKRLNEKVIAFLDANAQVNRYTNTYGTIAGTETQFPADFWTPDLIAELDISGEFNELNNPYMISGTNFRNAVFNAAYNLRNDDQRDQIAKLQHFDMYFDSRNVDTTTGDKATFMVDSGAVGFYPKNEFSNLAPQNQLDEKNTHTFASESMNLSYRNGTENSPVMYDVYHQRKCVVTTVNGMQKRRWGDIFELVLTGGLHTSPQDCKRGTGILKFVNI